MCSVSDKLDSGGNSLTSSSEQESESQDKAMNGSIGETESECSFLALLEFAADNDVESFKRHLLDASRVNQIGLWYSRQSFLRKMVLEPRTPLMVAAMYGSVDVVKLILSFQEVDLNMMCGSDKTTALHCAATGASVDSLDVVKLLLSSGADPNIPDAHGNRPVDVLAVSRLVSNSKTILQEILKKDEPISEDLHASSSSLGSSFRSLSSSPDNDSSLLSSDSVSSPTKPNGADGPFVSEKKEYPIDPSLPDIKSGIYSTDEFRMFSFKIRPCSRAYSHDWTECPFAHPGENARRRDPRKFHYTCVPCPDFKKGTCKRGDLCEYAHGVFECWLHPAQYRTRLCKDGMSCNRRVCFFAHTNEELRPLYASTGSGLPSPRSSSVCASTMDMATVLNMLPGSPSAAQHSFTPTMSPSGNGMAHPPMGWPQQNIPALHLPGSNLQLSRLRSSLNARDIPAEELSMLQDFEIQRQRQQLVGDMSSPRFMNHSGRVKSPAPSNLDELYSPEVSSPRFSDQLAVSSILSPSHKSALLKQSMLAPVKTNLMSPKNVEHPLLQSSFGGSSLGKMSPRAVEPISPMNSRLASLSQQQLHSRSLSSRDLGSADVGSPLSPWSRWDQSKGSSKVDWSVQSDELGRLRKSHSLANPSDETDVSWVQPLLKESASRFNPAAAGQARQEGWSLNPQNDARESDILDAWLEQLQLDRMVA
ncbi:PREDICTED: zinc finger CCCH domain-containing protein 56-like isoform X2 [Tarenaya hassleriana]|uniref:zinc finger CCCH domain-containing protein 56-like isoform X1 n=1 Tax=Tarenaya hassleriana TaxID=28532 RepID=UPI00053C17F4|nr:PREDICTED: zinc finger CCCH domain-containing protein 56-like isoform X1 [Tarenaya hassleriana]XP_019059410.1 PREDICTED: zinc finger CCCH domain-containing protein 56-like isoform X2 [Tarenaya hassleriana]